jgi:hypothetical protein
MRIPTPLGSLAGSAWREIEIRTRPVGDRLAGLAAGIPDHTLEPLMRTPARRVVVETIFFLMPRYLDRSRAGGLNLAVRWHVTTPGGAAPDVYDLVIAERRCRVHRGPGGPRPLVTVTIDSTELLRLATGRSDPMQSYFSGKLGLRGDIMQAARLTALFRIPRPVSQ